MKSRILQASAMIFLFLNLCMYVVCASIAGWALNKALDHTFRISVVQITGLAGIPITFTPLSVAMGNQVTAFVVIFALIASSVGIGACLSGVRDVLHWNTSSLSSTATASMIAWSLTLLAMGCACKEIHIGGRNTHLRVLEAFLIILSATKLIYMLIVHAGFVGEANTYGEQRSRATPTSSVAQQR